MRFINKIFLSIPLLLPMAVWAERSIPGVPKSSSLNPEPNLTTPTDLFTRMETILGWVFALALMLGVAMLIVAGIMYITAAGSSRADTAVKIMIYAIIGIAVAGFAWAIVNVAQGLLFSKTVNVSEGGTESK